MTDQDPVGSAAEEATRLWGAFASQAAEAVGALGRGFDEHLATGAPECTSCPICRTIRIAREASPEVRIHLAAAAASLMQAAASVLTAVAATAPARTSTVEKIDLDMDFGDFGEVWPEESDEPGGSAGDESP